MNWAKKWLVLLCFKDVPFNEPYSEWSTVGFSFSFLLRMESNRFLKKATLRMLIE